MCNLVAVPKPAIQWSRDGGLVRENSLVTITQGGKVLSISTVNETDDGWYTCEAENYLGSTRFSYQLTVLSNKSSSCVLIVIIY